MIKRRTSKVFCFVFCFLMENIKGCSFQPYNNILFIKFYTLQKGNTPGLEKGRSLVFKDPPPPPPHSNHKYNLQKISISFS